jgi:hypothetical protein
MGEVLEFRPNRTSVRRLAKAETERLYELYRISAGGQDPVPTIDPEVLRQFHLGIIEMPWSYWHDGF